MDACGLFFLSGVARLARQAPSAAAVLTERPLGLLLMAKASVAVAWSLLKLDLLKMGSWLGPSILCSS
jgi:hypothetical protein